MPRTPHIPLVLIAALVACDARLACAESVELETGGRVEGALIRDGANDRSRVTLELSNGRLVLDRSQVDRITTEPTEKTEYTLRAPTTPDNTEAQWAFALWCRDRGLSDQMRTHLERVVQLDPNHEEARLLLGYQQVNGGWVTREQLLEARGLVRYEGDFRTRQEVALLQRKKLAEQAAEQWRDKLGRWRRDLNSSRTETALDAQRRFEEVRDPAAATALVRLLRGESDPLVQLLLIQTLGYIDNSAAVEALVSLSLESPDGEVRMACVEALVEAERRGLVGPYVRALSSRDNAMINRAGEALGMLGEPAAIGPLIGALVTEHRHQVGNDSGGDSYSLNTGTGQHSFGGGGPKIIRRQIRNPSVLAALAKLSGVNFSYNVRAWENWLSSQARATPVDLRRDF
ncbi:HEAT repeat domain-containing protein [Pseudobythopirellula maris]|nr:HEAT repeat domain-containing protein [Pseudobythopirellula maris]